MKRWLSFGGLAVAILMAIGMACAPAPQPAPPTPTPMPEPAVVFAKNAFPPPIPDKPWHHQAWLITDCMGCHGKELGEAPTVKHEGLPELLLQVNCRTCHVLISEEATLAPKK